MRTGRVVVRQAKQNFVVQTNLRHAAALLPGEVRLGAESRLGHGRPAEAASLEESALERELERLAALGAAHDCGPQYWKSLEKAAAQLGRRETAERMHREFLSAVRRRVETYPRGPGGAV
jgi:hypothetical protein